MTGSLTCKTVADPDGRTGMHPLPFRTKFIHFHVVVGCNSGTPGTPL